MVDGERDSATGQFVDMNGEIVSPSVAKGRILELPFQNVQHLKITSVSNLIMGSSQLRFNLGYQLNNRREYEATDENPNLFMKLNTLNADAKFTHLFAHDLELVAGLSGMAQTNTNKGEEYLIPAYTLGDAGGFIYIKKSWTKWTLNAGLRYDARWVNGESLYLDSLGKPSAAGDTIFPGFRTTFSACSGSAGFTFAASKVFNFKFNLGSGFRAPNIAELGSNGIHPGTIRYEIGNPSLNPENSLQADGAISADWFWVSATFSGFYNYIANYIYQRNLNGETISRNGITYPVYRFVQGNSTLKGFEFELDFHPIEQLHFENSIDYVIGTNVTTAAPLPFIPALHTVHDLKYTFKTPKNGTLVSPYISVGAEIHFAQNRIDTFETPTPGYFQLDAEAGTRLRVQNQTWMIFVAGKNLTNTKFFDHLSRLKEVGIYNPGWNVTIGVVIPFGVYEEKKP
jgi:iron complex outermembrane receptor protein